MVTFKRVLAALLAMSTAVAQAQSTDDTQLAELIRDLTDRSGAQARPADAVDGISLDLGGGFQHAFIAELGTDGSMRARCVGSVGEANAFFGRNLYTGAALPPPKSAPAVLHDMAALHGMTPEEYAFYWNLIEQAQASPRQALSSTITIQNNDGAGEGFNDPTATAAEGGNTGATRGQQRLNVFNFAAGIWAAFLDSTVTITVRSNFDPLTPCGPGGGVLGSAGPINVNRDFANRPFANTWYVAAVANKIAGSDLVPANPELSATFNSSIDTGCLGAGSRFYYGLDNSTPANRVNLLVVVLHEIGHGLGFLSLANESTGALLDGRPDAWTRLMFDRTSGPSGRTWFEMTDAQRAASAINTNNLLWDGANVRIASGFLTAAREAVTGRVELYTPSPLQPGSSVSHWNTTASPNLLMEPSINTGLPLTLDLTRQLMRDIGWFRDADNNVVADVISNVQPSGGTLAPGANTTITWSNPTGFSRNVSIELSTDGGTSFPTIIASDVVNTGSRAWTVPNISTTQARIRVREHDFVAPVGMSAANINIGSNTAPTFTPAPALSRQQGSPAGAAVTVGTVSDAQTPAGSLVVTQIAGGTATGISVGTISNTGGTISAPVSASCTATAGTVRFQVSDGSLTGTGDLQVNVSANVAPTLSYANASINGGAGGTVNPATGPSDNGSIASIVVQSSGTYTGTISVNGSTGVVTLGNAAPVGVHTITIRATDDCGTIRDASFQLTVGNTAPTFTPAAALSRQQGSPAGAAVTVGTVSDAQTPAGSLVVTQIAGGTATGISVGTISNTGGTISAPVSASCTATAGTVRFQVSDGSLTGTGDLQVNVSANVAPTLSYANASINGGAGGTVNPATGPSDNGSIASIVVQSSGTYTGTISVNGSTGVVTLGNAAPVGVHTITIRATDDCGTIRDASFQLTVGGTDIFRDGFE
jgi:hypothetical protein